MKKKTISIVEIIAAVVFVALVAFSYISINKNMSKIPEKPVENNEKANVPNEIRDWNKYRNDGYGFEFYYPQDLQTVGLRLDKNTYILQLCNKFTCVGSVDVIDRIDKNKDIKEEIYNRIRNEVQPLVKKTYYIKEMVIGDYSVIRGEFLSEAAYDHDEVYTYIIDEKNGKYFSIISFNNYSEGNYDYTPEEFGDLLVKGFRFLSSEEILSSWKEYKNEVYRFAMKYPSEMEEFTKVKYFDRWNFSVDSIDDIKKRYTEEKDKYCGAIGCDGLDNEEFLNEQFKILREAANNSSFTEEFKSRVKNNFVLLTRAIDEKTRIESIYNKDLGTYGIKMIGFDGYDAAIDNFYYKAVFIVGDKVVSVGFDLFPLEYSMEEADVVKKSFKDYDEEVDFISSNRKTCKGGAFDPIISRYDLIAKSISKF